MKKLLLMLMLLFTMVVYGEDRIPTISITGIGQVETAPDMAVISFGIENTGKELAPIKEETDTAGRKVFDALIKAGIKREDFYTSSYTITHNYDYRTKSEPREKVYTVRNQLKLTVKDIKRIGELITLLEKNGVNTIQGISYTTSKKEELNLKALELAYQDAKKKAQHIAKLEGYSVEVVSISTNNSQPYPRPEVYMAADSMAKSTPVYTPGEISTNASIYVVFKLIK